MKIFKSKTKNAFYLGYRLIRPIFDPVRFAYGVLNYPGYIRDLIKFKIMDRKASIKFQNLFPILDENTPLTQFDAHYFHQQLWLFEHILKEKPEEHVDFGSTYELSGYLSKIVPTTFVDIRPIDTKLKNLTVKKGDVTNSGYSSSSLPSVSCLHVIEHIGLGRYGDPVDPQGHIKALDELTRVLKVGGKLYISCPIGRNEIYYNAHRVFDPMQIIANLKPLKLEEFSVVSDNGDFIQHIKPEDYRKAQFALGLFVFRK